MSQNRNLNTFSKISSEGTFKVTIIQGDNQSVEIIADDNIMNNVKSVVSDGELELYLKDGNYKGITVEVNISLTNFEEINNSGTGDIDIFDVDGDGTLEIVNSGTGNITVFGTKDKIIMENEGSGNFYGFNLKTSMGIVRNIGSGTLEVYCEDSLEANLEGSGDLYYMGHPILDISVKGSGKVISYN